MRSAALSIVVPALNESACIEAALAALAPLRARGAEIIVVDGGSTDGTAALAQPHAARVIAAPRGRAPQMNAGAAAARGDVLLFLHADTRLPADADRLVETALAQGAVWGRFDVAIEGRHLLLPLIARLMNLRSRLTGIATGDQAMFMRRDAFAACGGFPSIPLMEDIAMSRALGRLGRPACLRHRVRTSGRRWEKHGVLRTVLLMLRLRLAYFFGADPARLAQRYGHAPGPATRTAIAVLARAPVPGAAKTRLMPRLGADGAAALQGRLTLRTLTTATAAALGPVALFCAPDRRHAFFAECQERFGIPLHDQCNGDLGARMLQAFSALLPGHDRVLLVGTDCPALTANHLARAAALLDDHDAVVWPAEDGGYVLIGLRRPAPELFSGIDWGSARVMAQTRERLRRLGWRWAEAEPLWDVDRAEDYDRLAGANFLHRAGSLHGSSLRSSHGDSLRS
ncbi:MAG: TIGR04283 family arsenosugar biosynthesis glycosyltransferase [Rhodocyclales bacterium]|nr:TIGR04283 family arsenosugar biosynthesis glycosyltransferase [Rhodocyclales bacterium]